MLVMIIINLFYMVLGFGLRALQMLDKGSATELSFHPCSILF